MCEHKICRFEALKQETERDLELCRELEEEFPCNKRKQTIEVLEVVKAEEDHIERVCRCPHC